MILQLDEVVYVQVNCRMHQNLEVLPDQVLSFRLEIEDENTTRKLM